MTVHLPREALNPGCAVDIPAVFYSLSFAPNPDFSKVYPPQAEILEYFNKVADKFDVSRHIVRNTEWEGAYWQDLTNSWLVKSKDLSTGQTFYYECVETFEGDIAHTAAWKADLSLHQKDVIVVSNGCSAAQLIPAIAKEAGSITQFIRTPQFYLQNENMQIDDKWKFIFRYVPGVLRLLRLIVILLLGSTAVRFNINYKGNKARNLSAERSKAYIQSTALAPDLRQHLISFDFYQEEYPADAILLATGFALTQYEVELVGRNGRTRDEHWGNFGYKEAYKSTAMSGFPNFFYALSPNSGKCHTSAIHCIENYVNLVIKVISPALQDRASFVEVKPDSEKEYNENLHEKIATTIFNNSCGSYFIDYKSQKNWFIYPWNSFVMWYSTHWGRSDDWTYDV
ncbi:hypothetical protein N7449_012224, partial [Penicillium cf. viridicatum]